MIFIKEETDMIVKCPECGAKNQIIELISRQKRYRCGKVLTMRFASTLNIEGKAAYQITSDGGETWDGEILIRKENE
jgi:DNA-directed RNA polymerase subunit RPC12/RpoP